MDNPAYFVLFLIVGCVVVGVPWAAANRIVAHVRAKRADRRVAVSFAGAGGKPTVSATCLTEVSYLVVGAGCPAA